MIRSNFMSQPFTCIRGLEFVLWWYRHCETRSTTSWTQSHNIICTIALVIKTHTSHFQTNICVQTYSYIPNFIRISKPLVCCVNYSRKYKTFCNFWLCQISILKVWQFVVCSMKGLTANISLAQHVPPLSYMGFNVCFFSHETYSTTMKVPTFIIWCYQKPL